MRKLCVIVEDMLESFSSMMMFLRERESPLSNNDNCVHFGFDGAMCVM